MNIHCRILRGLLIFRMAFEWFWFNQLYSTDSWFNLITLIKELAQRFDLPILLGNDRSELLDLLGGLRGALRSPGGRHGPKLLAPLVLALVVERAHFSVNGSLVRDGVKLV